MEELKSEMSDQVDFETVDVSEDYEAAVKYGIQGAPTFVILGRDGSVLETLLGLREKDEIKSHLEKALGD